MKLNDVKSYKKYQIISFGDITKEEVLSFYEQGVIEGEIIKKKEDIKVNSKINLYEIDGNLFSINNHYLTKIEVEEYNE